MEDLCVLASTSQPGDDGRLPVAEDPLSGGRVQSFGQRREHYGDLLGGGFQTVQGRVTSGSERRAASRASKGLDLLSLARLAVPDKCMDLIISDAEVQTLLIRTGVVLRVHASGGLPVGFSLQARDAQAQTSALLLTRQGRRVDRRGNRLASGAQAAVERVALGLFS